MITIVSVWLRRQIYHVTPEPELAAALLARDRRAAARKLVADDPLIAANCGSAAPTYQATTTTAV